MSFDLRTEPWIPVLTTEMSLREVSLLDMFRDASSFKEVVGDNPPVTIAIYRMLLAIIHRAHRGPVDVAHWMRISDEGQKAVLAYLDSMGDRFDLRHAARPFMQDTALSEAQAAPSFVAAAWQAENTSAVFLHAHAWRKGPLSPAAAARTLLRLQTVDVPGLKSGHPLGGTNRSAVSSALMNSQVVWVRGENLWQTLMLNLMRYDGSNGDPFAFGPAEADLPAWERPMEPPAERLPQGPVDALTFAWRRVRLVWQGDEVAAIAVTKGNSLPTGTPAVGFEWALPLVVETDPKTGVTSTRALRASLEKRVWRDAPALLQAARMVTGGNRRHRAPALLEWLAQLHRATGRVPSRLRVQIFAVVADQAKPLGWFGQALTLPIRYLEVEELWRAIHEATMLAERYEECLRTFRGSPYQVLGEVLKLDAKALGTFDGRTRYWGALEKSFLSLLETLPDDQAEDEIGEVIYGQTSLPAWEQEIRSAVREAFEQSIAGIRDRQARALGLKRLEERLAALRAAAPTPSLVDTSV